ncbi:separin protein [Blastocladiella emersonii ATCC 22665]|nr:separin protein [Blastocladiella emersonii ATCC 22665]
MWTKLLLELASTGPVALWVVGWFALSEEPLASVCATLARLRVPPSPLLAAAELLEQHSQFDQDRLAVVSLVVDWLFAAESADGSSASPDGVLPWLVEQAHELRSRTDSPCPVQLAIRIAVAHGALVAGNGSLTRDATLAMSHVLDLLHEYNQIEQADSTGKVKMRLTQPQLTTLVRAGCRYVQAATRLTDAFDPANACDDIVAEPLVVIHDSISLFVARLFPYLAVSPIVGQSLFEWIMYLVQLLDSLRSDRGKFAPDLALVHDNIATAFKVCRHSAADSPLFGCLLRVSAVAHNLALRLFDQVDVTAPEEQTSLDGVIREWAKDREAALAGAIAIGKVAVHALAAYLERQPPSAAFAHRVTLARRYEFLATAFAARDALAGQPAYGHAWREVMARAVTVLVEGRAWTELAALIARNVRRQLASCATSVASAVESTPSPKYTPLCLLVRSHCVFALEWRVLLAAQWTGIARLVLQQWEAITPQTGLHRAHVLLAQVAQRRGVECQLDVTTAINMLLEPRANNSPDEILRTELLALAYCYHAFAQGDATHLTTAFELYERAAREKSLILPDDTRWHLLKLERVLDGRSMHSHLVQLYQILLLLEHGAERGNVLVRFALAYLALGHVDHAGKCLATASSYLSQDRRRGAWSAAYAMYLVAIGNTAKAATYLDQSGGGHDAPVADPTTALLGRLARIQLHEAEGHGTDALLLALETEKLAERASGVPWSLRLEIIARVAALFCTMGFWRDAREYSDIGGRAARESGNATMHYRFATIQATIAMYRRSLDDVRRLLEPCPVSAASTTSTSSRPHGLACSDSAVHLDLDSDDQPAVAAAGLGIKENVTRLLILGDAALLDAGVDIVSGSRPRPIPGETGPIDTASERIRAAQSLLERLRAPRHVADLFAADQRRHHSPRLQRFLHAGPAQQSATASTPSQPANAQQQSRQLVPLEADLVRARASLLFAQRRRGSEVERILIAAFGTLNLSGPLYPRFVHDATAISFAILKPHLAQVDELALLNESVLLLDATETRPTRNARAALDTRHATRVQMCRVHLEQCITRVAGVAHPRELAQMAHMLLHAHTIDLVVGGSAQADQGAPGDVATVGTTWSIRELLESACHGATTRRMARILAPNAGAPRPRTAERATVSAQSPAAAVSFMAAMRETPVAQRRSQSGAPAATPSRTTPRDQGPIEEDMLHLELGHKDSEDNGHLRESGAAVDPRVPSTWTVCQLAVDPARDVLYLSVTRGPHHAALRLSLLRTISRVESLGSDPPSFAAVRARLDAVVTNSTTMLRGEYKSRDAKYRWREERRALDSKLFQVLATVDQSWLGCFRGMVGGAGAQVPREAVRDFARNLAAFVEPARQPGASELVVPVLVIEAWLALVLVPVVPNPLVVGSSKPSATSLTVDDLEDMAYFILEECARQGFGVATNDLTTADDVDFDPLIEFLKAELRTLRQRYGRAVAAGSGDHAILILDAHLHAFPWESTAALRGRSVSRVFSLEMLHGMLAAAGNSALAADRDSVYYVLNPSHDLPTTQATFEPILRSESTWHGTIGAPPPSATDFASSMAAHDVFLYFGHGGGEALCRPKQLVEHLLSRNSLTRDDRGRAPVAAILMGCSSGKLDAPGVFDPIGTPVYYLIAMAASRGGCVVANLWDVTDRDIDRFTVSMLRRWGLFHAGKQADEFGFGLADAWYLPAVDLDDAGEAPVPRSLVEADVDVPLPMAVAAARDDCQLPFLIGAAPVVYGVPVRLTLKNR